jgi:hypothetical protein
LDLHRGGGRGVEDQRLPARGLKDLVPQAAWVLHKHSVAYAAHLAAEVRGRATTLEPPSSEKPVPASVGLRKRTSYPGEEAPPVTTKKREVTERFRLRTLTRYWSVRTCTLWPQFHFEMDNAWDVLCSRRSPPQTWDDDSA